MPEFLTNIEWSSTATIGTAVGIAIVVVVAGYGWWSWSQKKWPFNQ